MISPFIIIAGLVACAGVGLFIGYTWAANKYSAELSKYVGLQNKYDLLEKRAEDLINKLTPSQEQTNRGLKKLHKDLVKMDENETNQMKEEQSKVPPRIVLFDLEATCCWDDAEKPADNIQEIIEIGAVLVVGGKIVDEFQTYVKPSVNLQLAKKCTGLTGITQAQVDSAPSIRDAISMFREWIGPDYWLGSWGHYDRHQLATDCERIGMEIEWLRRHTSIKHEYSKIVKLKAPIGLGGAIRKEGMKFDGRPHSALAEELHQDFP